MYRENTAGKRPVLRVGGAGSGFVEIVVGFLTGRFVFFHALGFGAFTLEFFLAVQDLGEFFPASGLENQPDREPADGKRQPFQP